MTALLLADTGWITDHLMELHYVNFSGHVSWPVLIASIVVLALTTLYTRLHWGISALIGAVMVLYAHSDPSVHTGLLDYIGLTWHVLFAWLSCGVLFVVLETAASDQGEVPGKLRSAIEVVIGFMRDEVVRPNLGEEGDAHMPVIMTFFSFILVANLLGLTPSSTTVTGSIFCTLALALMSMAYYHAMGVAKFGLIPHIVNFVPVHADVKKVGLFLLWTIASLVAQGVLGLGAVELAVSCVVGLVLCSGFSVAEGGSIVLWLFLLVIELVGHIAKPFALMVRLFANMTGGHAVLYVALGVVFIFGSTAFGPISVIGGAMVLALELMVAFLQAFIFTMLTVVFLGGSLNPSH